MFLIFIAFAFFLPPIIESNNYFISLKFLYFPFVILTPT